MIASGRPIQTIRIPAAVAAPVQVNGSAGAFDKGNTILFITVHTKTPYKTAVKKILKERNFNLG